MLAPDKTPRETPSKSDQNLTAYTVSRQPCRIPPCYGDVSRRPLRHCRAAWLVFSSCLLFLFLVSFETRPSPFPGRSVDLIGAKYIVPFQSCNDWSGAFAGDFRISILLATTTTTNTMCGDSRPLSPAVMPPSPRSSPRDRVRQACFCLLDCNKAESWQPFSCSSTVSTPQSIPSTLTVFYCVLFRHRRQNNPSRSERDTGIG